MHHVMLMDTGRVGTSGWAGGRTESPVPCQEQGTGQGSGGVSKVEEEMAAAEHTMCPHHLDVTWQVTWPWQWWQATHVCPMLNGHTHAGSWGACTCIMLSGHRVGGWVSGEMEGPHTVSET